MLFLLSEVSHDFIATGEKFNKIFSIYFSLISNSRWNFLKVFFVFSFHFPFFPMSCGSQHITSLLTTMPALALIGSFFLGQFHIPGSSRSTPLFSLCIYSILWTTVPAKRGQNFYLGQSKRTDNLTKHWQKISIMESFCCFTDLIILWVKPWPWSTLCSSLNTPWKESTRYCNLISWHQQYYSGPLLPWFIFLDRK